MELRNHNRSLVRSDVRDLKHKRWYLKSFWTFYSSCNKFYRARKNNFTIHTPRIVLGLVTVQQCKKVMQSQCSNKSQHTWASDKWTWTGHHLCTRARAPGTDKFYGIVTKMRPANAERIELKTDPLMTRKQIGKKIKKCFINAPTSCVRPNIINFKWWVYRRGRQGDDLQTCKRRGRAFRRKVWTLNDANHGISIGRSW